VPLGARHKPGHLGHQRTNGDQVADLPRRSCRPHPVPQYRVDPAGTTGPGRDAALDFYYEHPRRAPDDEQLENLAEASDMVAALLMVSPHLKAGTVSGPAYLHSPAARARMLVWTAIGMITYTLRLNSADALARLRGYAYSHNSTIDDIARALTDQALPVGALDT
jgi:hypothetical protein